MKYKLPSYSFEEEYIDDPHWNSGFWQTTFKFNDGITFSIGKEHISDEWLENTYIYFSFYEYWKKVKSRYKDMARGEFLKTLEQQTVPQTI